MSKPIKRYPGVLSFQNIFLKSTCLSVDVFLCMCLTFSLCLCLPAEANEEIVKVTFGELKCDVALFAAAMRKMGIQTGDRVVGESQMY